MQGFEVTSVQLRLIRPEETRFESMMKVNVGSFLLAVSIGLLPVYTFSSGGLQPAHFLLILFSGFVFAGGSIICSTWSALLLAVFVHSFFVEAFYTMIGGDPRFLLNGVFFLYNLLISVAIYTHCKRYGISMVVSGTMVACIIGTGTVFLSGVDLRGTGNAGRATGAFNNPNQLGYFSACLLSLTYLAHTHRLIRFRFSAPMFASAVLLSIASLSKAAMIANFLVIFFIFKPNMSKSGLLIWGIGIAFSVSILVYLYHYGAFDQYLFFNRLANMASENDSSLESRGYFAIAQSNSFQMLLGLGGENVDNIVGHEVHSTLGSVLNNYGIFGFAIFSCTIGIWLHRLLKCYGASGMFCLAGPAMLYGITHNGTRFTIFWVLFAASMAMAERTLETRQAKRRQTSTPLWRDHPNCAVDTACLVSAR